MDFPSYVPSAVRVSVAALLDGDSWERTGWLSVLTQYEADLQRIQRQQDECLDQRQRNELNVQHAGLLKP